MIGAQPLVMDIVLRGYNDRGKFCRQFSLLIWNSFISQFVHPEGVGGDGLNG